MIPDCVVDELRATVFVSPIVYDASNLQRVQTVLTVDEGYKPNIVPLHRRTLISIWLITLQDSYARAQQKCGAK